ncbi:Retrovirus-related Pol polyprotein from transposon TNT 1-94 [Senna tora]|uniref:Protein FAR1-RELATED SEQUENCE n=1 Tax=Senna tora TaxID=362788 RepID=A0A834WAH3_9FABA|nr:Retrovirus-related Pol polyprotein from transposon TNT 1-94 [Senna tora]
MSCSETVEQYFSRVTDLVNKMRIYGENILYSKVVEKILRTMPIKYDHVVTTIIESHNLEEMSVAELQGSMESHVSRILEKTEKPVEEALKSQVTLNNATQTRQRKDNNGGPVYNSGGRERGRGNFRGRGRGNNYNPGKGNNDFRQMNQGRGGQNFNFQNRGRSRGNFNQNRNAVNCYHCEKFGHRYADCRLRGQQNFNTQANIAENQNSCENTETLFLASNNFSVDENVWYLDTCCSNHMCVKKELFSSLDESFNSSVKFGNSTNIPILGKGQISIRLKDGYAMRVHQGFCTLFDKNGRFVAKSANFDNVGFISKDLMYNHIEKKRRMGINDAMSTLNYLRAKAEIDPLMFLRYKVDDDGRLQHLFWADGSCCMDYECFNDVTSNSNFTSAFKSYMFGDYEVDEFEEKWASVVEKYGLNGNKWTQEVSEKKHIYLDYRRNQELKASFDSCYGWTKDAKSARKQAASSTMDEQMGLSVRYSSLNQLCNCLCSMAAGSVNDCNRIREKLGKMISNLGKKDNRDLGNSASSCESSTFVHEPIRS